MEGNHAHNIDLSEYLPLVRRIARHVAHHTCTSVSVDDLNSEGVLGLLQAARRYRPSGNASFTSYAWPAVRGHMLNLVNRENRHAHRQHDLVRFSPPEPEQALLFRERQRRLLGALEGLSPPRRRAITLLLAGRSVKEAAATLGISAQCVRRSKASAVRQLHEALCPAG